MKYLIVIFFSVLLFNSCSDCTFGDEKCSGTKLMFCSADEVWGAIQDCADFNQTCGQSSSSGAYECGGADEDCDGKLYDCDFNTVMKCVGGKREVYLTCSSTQKCEVSDDYTEYQCINVEDSTNCNSGDCKCSGLDVMECYSNVWEKQETCSEEEKCVESSITDLCECSLIVEEPDQ